MVKTCPEECPQYRCAKKAGNANSQQLVSNVVTCQFSDASQLPGLLEAVQDEYGHIPARVVTVADFRKELNLQFPE